MTPLDYDYLRRLLKERSGLVLSADKQYLVESRLLPLARRAGLGGLAELVVAVATGMRVSESLWPLVLIGISPAVVLAPAAWYFSSMTVTVTEDELRWRFGLGDGWRIARADIEAAIIVPHLWIAGYGIRWFGPKRWAYIISGRNAVEVRLKQGGWLRLGTDDPTGLLNALTTAPAA